MNSKKSRVIAAALVLLLAGGLYAWWRRPDPNFERARALQQQLLEADGAADPQKWEALREASRKLKPEQRQALGELRERHRDNQLIAYAQMSPQEKVQHLDRQIQRMEQFRKQWEARRAAGGQQGGGQQPRAAGFGGSGQGGSGRPGGRALSAEERDKRTRQRLDGSSPQTRTARTIYYKDLNARRQQLGLPPLRGPRR
jgi:hypothetical protein